MLKEENKVLKTSKVEGVGGEGGGEGRYHIYLKRWEERRRGK